MKKLKFSIGKIGKYLLEISVVVIGVAITLSVSFWISQRGEKRDYHLYVSAVKLELTDNIRYLSEEKERLLSKEFEYARYLKSHEKKQLNLDSIRYYAKDGYTHTEVIAFRKAAFEMFKSSGAMRLMQNKEVMQKIWEAYFLMQRHEITLEKSEQIKIEYLNRWLHERELTPNAIPLYYFYVSGIYDAYLESKLNIYEEISELLKEIVEELDKEFNE
jgi:hypothetical protein